MLKKVLDTKAQGVYYVIVKREAEPQEGFRLDRSGKTAECERIVKKQKVLDTEGTIW